MYGSETAKNSLELVEIKKKRKTISLFFKDVICVATDAVSVMTKFW